MKYDILKQKDPVLEAMIEGELNRQCNHIELIASENFVSPAVLEAAGTILTNKYAEGYKGRRYYGGCEFVDEIEVLAIERAKKLFNAEHANVQPHSGANANLAAFFALINVGDTVLSMDLSHGGHLTHGSKVNFSGVNYNIVHYYVDKQTERIDYDEVERLANLHKPKLILAGASSYPRMIDFERFAKIAKSVGAYLMVDMAHIAGLVLTGLHQSPVPYADIVTTTTHKTLRGPRGGMILCKAQYAKAVDKAVFPGLQGGPLVHIIAAKAVAFLEAMKPEFVDYQRQVLTNSKALAKSLMDSGIELVSNGTDNHLMLLKLMKHNITGAQLCDLLEACNITTNKNTLPFDTLPPTQSSGLRVGTPAVTTRGMKEAEMAQIADFIVRVISGRENAVSTVKKEVEQLCKRFPLYQA